LRSIEQSNQSWRRLKLGQLTQQKKRAACKTARLLAERGLGSESECAIAIEDDEVTSNEDFDCGRW
jgi:hypothetical protein